MISRRLFLAVFVASAKPLTVISWIYASPSHPNTLNTCNCFRFNRRSIGPLQVAPSSPSSVPISNAEEFDLIQEEWDTLHQISQQATNSESTLEDVLLQALPTLHPRLILKLRQVEANFPSVETLSADRQTLLMSMSQALQSVLNSQLVGAKQVLETMLQAGEIRKLDAAIGKAARQRQLDAAFFTVLQMNLEDAAASEQQQSVTTKNLLSTDKSLNDPPASTAASRVQILKHVRTRCQEEVEKEIPPGMALLNKLLRTEQPSIRTNQLKHYLCPQAPLPIPDAVVSKQDANASKPGVILIPPSLLVEAVSQMVQQIRTLETAGGISRESAAAMVESCRQLSKEARIVLAQEYGLESEQVQAFEDELMPVFRPASSDSPYIQGV